MPSVVNDIILWLSPTLGAFIVWLCHVLFKLVQEKIEITKEIAELKVCMERLSLKQEGMNVKLGNLETNTAEQLKKIDESGVAIKTQLMMSDQKLTVVLGTIDEHGKKHADYGRVFLSLTEYLKSQRKNEKHKT